ncbi:hypothetical protein ACFPOE_11310 [Caenimonas terrae]|uniref:Lytic transglycosylase domain-containing protein n=1 Tax=Caenimonas terrae TaxID=696074 RepID=A0ABW0NDV5_9BURK
MTDDKMPKLLRRRSWVLWLLPALVLAWLFFTDPDGGRATEIWVLRVVTAFIAVALTHLVRKAYFDYPEADLRKMLRKAVEEPTGAGLAMLAIMVFLTAVLMLFAGQVRAQDVRTYIPPNAQALLPVLASERRAQWPDHPDPAMLAALIEHESCITLKRASCWNPASRLKSAREEGAGLGQITRTWRKDGSLRFDALEDLRGRHPALGDWSWENVYRRPDLQLRAVVLMGRDNFTYFHRLGVPAPAALQFADAGYNGGNAGVQDERRACKAAPGCDPARWFGHVELHCLKSREALYGGRSACDINRHHVVDVVLVRTPKYRGLV